VAKRIVLVDDHMLFRSGLALLLAGDPDFTIVGDAGDARSAYDIVEATNPDVIVVDIGLPGTNGIAVARELLRRDRRRRILMLSMHDSQEFVAQAMLAGALGYALKHQPPDEIREAIATVARGESYLAPTLAPDVIESCVRRRRGLPDGPLAGLSAREREVFDMLVRGYSNQAVGKHLSISVKTVETHRTHIMKKLRLHSLPDMIRFATRHQLISDLGGEPQRNSA
jgi:DNA-binding NarL/FixJ family response regulator